MAKLNVTQNLNHIVIAAKRGKSPVLNLQVLKVTVLGEHTSDGLYSKWEGDAFELAKVQVRGSAFSEPRPFMNELRLEMKGNKQVAMIIRKNMRYDRKQKGHIVNWDAMSLELETWCQGKMTDIFSRMPPIKDSTKQKKARAGYDVSKTLYAQGELAKCIAVEVE